MSKNFDALGAALTQSIPPMLTALEAMEVAQQAYHPARPNAVAEFLGAYTQGLEEAIAALAPHQFPEHVRQFETHLKTCLKYAARSTDNFSQVVNDDLAFLRASRTLCKAREALFPLATLLNPIHQFFLEPSLRQSTEISDHWLAEAEQSPISHIENDYTERGGASIYIPHNLNTDEPTPLVISLHGGGGHGRDQLWSWLREARSRSFILVTPTSAQETWPLSEPEQTLPQLLALIQHVASVTNLDKNHILLSGMSDGGTHCLQLGLMSDTPFTHLAPFSGTLDPNLVSTGRIQLAREKPIYLVHGQADWMFPHELGDFTAQLLTEHHADLCYRSLPGLGHAFARSELPQLLSWFAPTLTMET